VISEPSGRPWRAASGCSSGGAAAWRGPRSPGGRDLGACVHGLLDVRFLGVAVADSDRDAGLAQLPDHADGARPFGRDGDEPDEASRRILKLLEQPQSGSRMESPMSAPRTVLGARNGPSR